MSPTNKLNLVGKTFGKLTVLISAGLNRHQKTLWLCQCECGNQKTVIGASLTQGKTVTCGCGKSERFLKINKEKFIDLVGQNFGKLKVVKLEYPYRINRHFYWYCICDCGKTKIASSHYLKWNSSGNPSCGCANRLQLNNQKFGKLFVKSLNDILGQRTYWNCICDCGNEKIASGKLLVNGDCKSCGCLNLEIMKNRTRENHPNWRFDMTDVEREFNKSRMYLPEYTEWRNSIYKRDNWTCQLSGQNKGLIEAHHIFNWANNKNERYDLDNGITLSVEVHKLFHKLYGRKFNTLEQFLEFKSRYISGEFCTDYSI